MTRKMPEIIEVDRKRVEQLLHRAEQSLDTEDCELIRAVFESYAYVSDLVEDKNTSIRRLRKLFFGSRTEKTAAVVGDAGDSPGPAQSDAVAAKVGSAAEPSDTTQAAPSPSREGHGRHAADSYRGGEQIDISHRSLQAGDACPDCGKGTLYERCPGVWVRIIGQAPLGAKVYRLQKLRCHLCGKIFTAELPADGGTEKYDATAASMIALLKYGSGLPFNRLEGLQKNLEIPLPASTQWEVIHAFAPGIQPAFDELVRQAAQGDVLHNDDTTIKILDLMGERARQCDQESSSSSSRTGLFTSGVVAVQDGRRVALFFSGRQHAGENLADVLKLRASQLDPPVQMCDALSRNLPGELATIVANCLAHARRRFVDVHDRFPDECRYVLEALSVVYRHDAEANRRGLSPAARRHYHQQHSQPTMHRLHTWLRRQIDEKLVEPNSALGEAIGYMLKHWDKLTKFLQQPGAPLDNNLCERTLKKAILHRKNSLFFKSENGARIGDQYMSLIHTCELCGVNPFEYLTTLLRHPDELSAAPDRWMPWNYQASLQASSIATT